MNAHDPVCIIHGKRHSEHLCLYCCMCYKPLTIEECHVYSNGTRENICEECAALEEVSLAARIATSEQAREIVTKQP